MPPLFSIIVPIYKVQKYLAQCVDSIINQSYKNIEIILVDDGSPDNCPQICDEYAELDTRVKVIHKQNGGSGSARQAGAVIAAGKYIACVDGDDWISETYFERFAKIIAIEKPDIICCGMILTSEIGEIKCPFKMQTGLYTRRNIENKIFPVLIEREDGAYFSPSVWAKVFKKEIYRPQQLVVNPAIKIGEDNACVKPCIYRAQTLYIIEDCLYYYRQNQTSITRNKKPFDWDGPKLIGQHFEKQINMTEHDFQEQVDRNVVHNLFNVAVSQFNLNNGYGNISKDIKEHLIDSYYVNAINNCYYKGLVKGKFAQLALKHKCTFLMYVYNRVKR